MNKEQLQGIFRQPYNAGMWQELLINLFGASEIRQTPSTLTSDTNEMVEGFQLGLLTTTDRYEIGLFAFEIKQGHNLQLNRVGLRSLVKSYTRLQVDAAIVVFYDSTHWRLSFICDIKEQKTAPKRYTYVFGNPDESYHTASAMLAKLSGEQKLTFEQIKAAFSVEALSKDFFKGYKQQYANFCKYIGGEQKWQRDYVKKMMGRLVFLQFLQKKGWMGCSIRSCGSALSQADWTGGDLQYTQNLVAHYKDNEKLLSDVLEPLFFDTLNKKREGDIADPILGNNIKIPYLNGGLFDKDKLDENKIDFPYTYFSDLMDFFSQYNFTIDENDPYDSEVGIDPEMLGHIFENLLEDNKDKGAFYTPKEIVQYMCRQSLIEYLQSKLGKHTEIEDFINTHQTGDRLDKNRFIASNAKAIEELLDKVKVCDPAIGSGAFPMGILNEIFHAKMALNMTLDRAEVKKNIIQNSIYGVDIEQGAVDIARLRFWLSLVVDDDKPQPLPNLDYKIMCGNSLLSRFALDTPINEVFAQYNKENKTNFTLESYRQLVREYTNTTSHETKAEFRQIIEEIKRAFKTELGRGPLMKRSKLSNKIKTLESPTLFGPPTKENLKEAKELRKTLEIMLQDEQDVLTNKLYEDSFEWRFELPALLDDNGDFMGFDIIIGNPPYVDVKALDNAVVKEYFRKYSTTSNRINLYSIFIEHGHNILNSDGILCYINPNSMLVNSSYLKLRELIISDITTIIKLPDNIFEAATVETIIFLLAKNQTAETVKGKYYQSSDKADLKGINYSLFERSIWKSDPDKRFNIFTDTSTTNIINKIVSNSTPLIQLADFSLGITPYDKAKGHSQEFIKSKGFHSDVKLTEEYVPLIKGANIYKYTVSGYGGEYLKYSKELGAPRQKRFFTDEKVIVRQILSANPLEMIAAYSDEDHYFTQIGFSIIPKDKTLLPVKYLLCLLNSKVINFFHSSKYLDQEKVTFPKILIENSKQFPIKIAEDQKPFIDLVDKILELKKANPTADTTALESQINQMVYALYNLTEDEIKIIEK